MWEFKVFIPTCTADNNEYVDSTLAFVKGCGLGIISYPSVWGEGELRDWRMAS